MRFASSEEDRNLPIYQQIVNSIIKDIQSFALPPGSKLPTVRELARENGLSQGTAKHAYDLLEQLGYIEKAQGRGTFVSEASSEGSKKDLAMEAIDQLFDRMEQWGFSAQETRIFLDLKLRERESDPRVIKIAAVDCCPEASFSMCRQIMTIPHIDVHEYLLESVLGAPSAFRPNADIIVTTPTHYQDLSAKLAPDQNLFRIVMTVSRETLLALARIPQESRVGIICASRRFADIITRTCSTGGMLVKTPDVAYLGSADLLPLLDECDQIILPSEVHRFATAQEQELIRQKTAHNPPVYFQYQIDKGSFLHLEEQVESLYEQQSSI